ncbi:ArnT family glycosyltransferase [Flavobacterium cellulosilyticum]|uniref:Glycosyltransferase family 39 protein n=1 Tax=Flavobacterium cellulosilyticum TaxID=2541731 RepID=A0A4R5C883_9FLAO|nr:glycosyltransferase family 39 protein [Flavobacterium cellulosilyticum]TDD95988.1 glycosyltransferase family 39 protein [Flavobacterium cellulosilyticum]
MISDQLKNNSKILSISVIVLVLFRLLLTITIPLLDKTEARYAEIARIMQETNHWIVLQIDYGVPFWAKPPLSTWLSASSFEVFGVNGFASRFPSFLISIILIIIAGKIVKKEGVPFYLPGFILLTMPEFLIHTGVVSTDTSLEFCVVIMMISFWKTIKSDVKTYWNYLFFIALGLGFLAKGPLIIVLTFPPLFLWCCLDLKRFKEVFSKFSIIPGLILTAIIAIPWYYFAEKESPGFLDYFIVGEHYKRFVESGWKGDLYGSGHSQPKGMIWVFLIAFALPWIQVVLYKLWKIKKTILKNDWVSFLVLWAFWTPLFFTISSNILHTYILPSTMPIMFLMVYFWDDFTRKKLLIRIALIFPIIVFFAYFGLFATGKLDYKMNTDKYLLENLKVTTANKEIPLYYWKEKNYSGQFYSYGKAQIIKNETELDSILNANKKIFFVIPTKKQTEIANQYLEKMKLVESNYKTSIFESK